MRRIAATGFAIAAIAALAGCATPGSGTPQKPQEVNRTSLPAQASAAAQAHPALGAAILEAVNDYREANNLGRLTPDANLQRAAAVHAADMELRGFFGHFNPDAQGPRERVLAVEPGFAGRVAENIQVVEGTSYGSMSDAALAAVLVEKWLESPMHRKNIRAPEMTGSGIGIARRSNRIVAVQVFSGP
ncbi:MAG: hypothetical protein CVT81_04280 [Alphaproteobacteria bacterium HGW-Alphaproteobacteria-3]|nr:MAG: hypothetical protein CVT81_04280 [Alphaproteobacteria bacterium HGW-Alphaproteobacteria-3]